MTWSDADCLWVRDYFSWFDAAAAGRADLVAQRGAMPADVARRVGAAVCAGLFTGWDAIVFNVTSTYLGYNRLPDFLRNSGDSRVQNMGL